MKAFTQHLMKWKNAFVLALPVILFFLFLFYTILIMFGVQYVIMVSFLTVLFKVRYQKKQTARKLIVMVIVQLVLALLAFLATRNILLCILMNSIVPFLLVLLQSSQFNQKGYFSSAMGFVFLQLRPISWNQLPEQLLVLSYGLSMVVLALCLCSFLHRKKDPYAIARKGLVLLAEQLSSLGDKDNQVHTSQLFSLQQSLHKLTYASRGVSYLMSREGKLHYMTALLFQRSIYFITKQREKQVVRDEEDRQDLQTLAEFTSLCSTSFARECTAVLEEGKELLALRKGKEDDLSLFWNNYLQLLLLILRDAQSGKVSRPHREWRLPDHLRPLPYLRSRLHLDSFEFRFALRLSVVLVIGFLFNALSGMNHAYWFPLNAFLLLQPMQEDSARRVKTRFIGTCAGCILIYFLLPFFPGVNGHFLFSTIMVTFMYCAVPGTWPQALFSTCFAITLTSMAMQQTIAIELRLLYVICAILMVMFINRFFLPTSLPGQFHKNMREMFHLQHVYQRLLLNSLRKPVDYGIISDGLTSFHMVYDQIIDYLHNPSEDLNTDYYRHVIALFWRMTSEMEQLLFLMNNQKVTAIVRQEVENYSLICDYVILHMQTMLHIKKEAEPADIGNVPLHLQVKEDLYLSELLHNYARNLSDLYVQVLHYVMK